METGYTLKWFDQLVWVTLNPEHDPMPEMNDEQLQIIAKEIRCEKTNQLAMLRQSLFDIMHEPDLQFFITKYYSSIINLLDQVETNLRFMPSGINIWKANQHAASSLSEILLSIYDRYQNYVSVDGRAPKNYLLKKKNEWKFKWTSIIQKFVSVEPFLESIISDELNFIMNSDETISIRKALYFTKLLSGIESLNPVQKSGSEFSPLITMLIFLNFNSRSLVDFITHHISTEANRHQSVLEKLDHLLLTSKALNQILVKPQLSLDPENIDLKTSLSNWLAQEIIYLEKKLHLSVIPYQMKADPVYEKRSEANKTEVHKVLCVLTVDQMAIALRAADDMRLVVARSISAVFKQIVPYLSSPYKEDISPDSMRSKSYVVEERDKEIVIQTLNKMIKKIEEY